MDKKPLVFFTSVSDEYYHSYGADKLVKSAKYFHPDIPFVVLGTAQVNLIHANLDLNPPFLFEHFLDEYKTAVRFDADSMLTGPLDELLGIIREGDFDVIAVRNNNDFGMAGKDSPIVQHNVDVDQYKNTGLIAVKSREFIERWKDDNMSYGKYLPFVCQTTFNSVCRFFNTKIVDNINTGVYYGTSGLFGRETHWDSWKKITIDECGVFHLNGKVVKVIHHAGGFKADKLGFYMFNAETRKRLIQITS